VILLTTATLTQSITHINALTIIHNSTKSTNGSSSRKEHNLVIHDLKETLRFQANNAINANVIIIEDLHSVHENNNLLLLQSAITIGKISKHKVNTTKYTTNHFLLFL